MDNKTNDPIESEDVPGRLDEPVISDEPAETTPQNTASDDDRWAQAERDSVANQAREHDNHIRTRCVDLAVASFGDILSSESTKGIVKRAQAFHDFVSGKANEECGGDVANSSDSA